MSSACPTELIERGRSRDLLSLPCLRLRGSGVRMPLADGAVVGRIMKVHAAPVGTPWMWTSRADGWLCGHPRDRRDGIRQELTARMTKKRRVYRPHIAGNQVMRPTTWVEFKIADGRVLRAMPESGA